MKKKYSSLVSSDVLLFTSWIQCIKNNFGLIFPPNYFSSLEIFIFHATFKVMFVSTFPFCFCPLISDDVLRFFIKIYQRKFFSFFFNILSVDFFVNSCWWYNDWRDFRCFARFCRLFSSILALSICQAFLVHNIELMY